MAEPTVQVPVSLIERLMIAASDFGVRDEEAVALAYAVKSEHAPLIPSFTPPRIQDMVPGTTFTAVDPGRLGDRATFEVLNNHRGRNVETWVHWAPSSFISSTIRDVTPPKEPTA